VARASALLTRARGPAAVAQGDADHAALLDQEALDAVAELDARARGADRLDERVGEALVAAGHAPRAALEVGAEHRRHRERRDARRRQADVGAALREDRDQELVVDVVLEELAPRRALPAGERREDALVGAAVPDRLDRHHEHALQQLAHDDEELVQAARLLAPAARERRLVGVHGGGDLDRERAEDVLADRVLLQETHARRDAGALEHAPELRAGTRAADRVDAGVEREAAPVERSVVAAGEEVLVDHQHAVARAREPRGAREAADARPDHQGVDRPRREAVHAAGHPPPRRLRDSRSACAPAR
jgi:hypothetical protein